jgi:hypothetical protein
MIITKSISRFVRNTVVLLETVRELKNLGINIYFERENIHSMSGDGELMLTILASFAQEESLSVSENCKWRIRDKFKNGKPPNLRIYGYKLINGVLEIIPEEAKVIKMIFSDYMSGMGKNAIMKKLTDLDVPTKNGGRWSESSIGIILRNEKYCGDMLLQKTFISNHLDKKKCTNNGELPKYLVKASHEAIIDEETFKKVQEEIKNRANPKQNCSEKKVYTFSSKVKCAKCRKNYKRKITGTKYQKPVWICQTFNQNGKAKCNSKQIPEDILELKCAEILEISEFNSEIFDSKIQSIEILDNNLVFIFKNGKRIETKWQNKSRKENWTEEMKKAAKMKTKERYEKCSKI